VDVGIEPVTRRRTDIRRPARVAVGVGLIAVAVTAVASFAAAHLERRTRQQLLENQSRQAAALIGSTIVALETPLHTALEIAGAGASPAKVSDFLSTVTRPGAAFVTASLWRVTGSTVMALLSVGAAPALPASSPAAHRFVVAASTSALFQVRVVAAGPVQHVSYALADPASHLVVYAERLIPPNRVVPVEHGSAFSDLNFATYLGKTTATSALTTTNVELAHLPLRGMTSRVEIPFGSTTLTLVTSARSDLDGTFARQVPRIVLVVGLALSVLAVLLAWYLARREREAEATAATIFDLYRQVDGALAEQRSIALTLQHALLPPSTPVMEGVDVATKYVASGSGVEVGGDWYSVIEVEPGRFAFVVGDVSGSGVRAAAVMAKARFTLRAYLRVGHGPGEALTMCSDQFDIMQDGHMVTTVVGLVDAHRRRMRLASAGHLPPLICTPATRAFAPLRTGRPLGSGATSYTETEVSLDAPDCTVLVYTDGLVERRIESIEDGLQRLQAMAFPAQMDLEDWVDDILTQMQPAAGPTDDIAVLAFRLASS